MSHLPTRTNTVSTGYTSDDDAVPTGDPSSTLGLLEERLQAWKHMTGYLEDYVKAVAKDQHSQSKDNEKILKTLNNPLKEGHHFDQALGGVAGLFENLRANTQAQGLLYAETEKSLTTNVLPILERLHKEIKAKRKELDSGAGKQSKAVENARNNSQKHIELLGQQTATFDSSGGKTTAAHDPYVIQRGTWHRLNKQLAEENSHRSDLINVQGNFQQFESHIITAIQTAFTTYNQLMAAQYDRSKVMFGDMAQTASAIDPNFEWNGFVQRNGHILISPNAPARSIDSMTFPNLNHRSTKALIEGSLERKRGIGAIGGYKASYYAVTPAGYMHEYKDNDNFHRDPEPETSLYLPDCIIGAVDGQKFTIKGKDTSGSKLSQKMSMSSDYQLKAHTSADAVQWHSVIASVTGGASSSLPTSPVSPVGTQNQIPATLNTAAVAQQTSPTATTASPQVLQHQQAGHEQPASSVAAAPIAPVAHQQTGVIHPPARGDSLPQSQQAAPAYHEQPVVGQPVAGQPTTYHVAPQQTGLEPRKF